MSYQYLAAVYDKLMGEDSYEEWLSYIQQITREYSHTMKHIVDLGCGTGRIAISLSQQGYRVIGVDLSEDMLAVAQQKTANSLTSSVEWIQQNMVELELPMQVDTVLCLCDSINYLLCEEEVQSAFQQVYQHLTPEGLFIFDMHSLYYVQHAFGNNLITSNDRDISLLWQCEYVEGEAIVYHDLTFFVHQGADMYQRYDESHTQRGYSLEQVVRWLEVCGFRNIQVTADFEHSPPNEQSHRIFVVAQK